jgi:glycine/D-amino acid oxidase-like deaminating enzyme/nitrite reductase/ring-hydroxylating ferredoxin subunit
MMSDLPGKPASLWIESSETTDYPILDGETSVDVAIIGAGIAGLTAAYLLKKAGKTVAVIESHGIVEGVTGFTTAKVTSLHHLIYADLMKTFGEEGARLYGESNEAALAFIADLAGSGIECDFERQAAFTYTELPEEIDSIKAEVQAAQTLGLPASFVTETALPFPITGAVKFEDQAQFHPRKYLLALARTIPGDGSHIFENTRATGMKEGEPCSVETDRGTVVASDVFVATNMPIFDRGLFFAKVHPQRSYVVTARTEAASSLEGMYISLGGSTRSIRRVPFEGGQLLMVGGEGHKTGQELDTPARYKKLEAYAAERFGAVDFVHRWSTQDCTSVDRVPYIGRLHRRTDSVHVATGFGKWGMTNGTVAAMIVTDLILERPNKYADLYDAKRLNPVASAKDFAQENVNVAQHFIGDRLSHPQAQKAEDLAPGQGGIVTVAGGKAAAYRDEDGELHAFSHICTHLACHVRWNQAESSFDCPCHGSRFDNQGRVIQGPAVKDLERKEV